MKDHAKAGKDLERAIALRRNLLAHVEQDEDLASLRATPEFRAMLQEIKQEGNP